MERDDYARKAMEYVEALCSIPGGRSAGSPGNREATEIFLRAIGPYGFDVEATPFDCLDFAQGGATLECGGKSPRVRPSPYSPGCDAEGKLAVASTAKELEKSLCRGKILLLRGEICAEHLMPRNYPFYRPEGHQKVYALLEAKEPRAIVTASRKNPQLMGAMYPCPLIEDGDFDIPSAYCTVRVGERIAGMAGEDARLTIRSERIPSAARNVIARKGPARGKKAVVCAHIDARPGMPGALDNASGVAALLILAEMLADYGGRAAVELAAISGEEHYSACGELDYLKRHGHEMGRTTLAVNVDGMGYAKGRTAFSLYGCPAPLARTIRGEMKAWGGLAEGEQWIAGDHMVFAQSGVPAMALTSEHAAELTSRTYHTPRDAPALADPEKIAGAAAALAGLVGRIA